MQKLYWLKPVKDLRTLTMVFATPDPFPVRFWKPASYLSHLIGHESAGSVLSLLKDRGWATALSASCGHYERDYGRFSISIELTVDGLSKNFILS
jgi:insulysin